MTLRSGAMKRRCPRMRVPSGSVMGAPLLTVTVSTPSGMATAELLQVLLLVGLVGGVEEAHQLLAELGRHEARHDTGHSDNASEPASRLSPADLVDEDRGDDCQADDRLDDGSDGDLVLGRESDHAASSSDDVEA